MEIFHQSLKDTPHISLILLISSFPLFFKHSAANMVALVEEVKWMQLNQRNIVLYIGSFNEKSPFVYPSVFWFHETLKQDLEVNCSSIAPLKKLIQKTSRKKVYHLTWFLAGIRIVSTHLVLKQNWQTYDRIIITEHSFDS